MRLVLPALLALLLAGCAASNNVVSDRWIQKRKYRSGFFTAHRSQAPAPQAQQDQVPDQPEPDAPMLQQTPPLDDVPAASGFSSDQLPELETNDGAAQPLDWSARDNPEPTDTSDSETEDKADRPNSPEPTEQEAKAFRQRKAAIITFFSFMSILILVLIISYFGIAALLPVGSILIVLSFVLIILLIVWMVRYANGNFANDGSPMNEDGSLPRDRKMANIGWLILTSACYGLVIAAALAFILAIVSLIVSLLAPFFGNSVTGVTFLLLVVYVTIILLLIAFGVGMVFMGLWVVEMMKKQRAYLKRQGVKP